MSYIRHASLVRSATEPHRHPRKDRRIVEKPEHPDHYAIHGRLYISMNIFRFTPHIFAACEQIEPHPVRGEYEIPSAVQHLIDHRAVPVRVLYSTDGVLDLTSKADILTVRAALRGEELLKAKGKR